MPLTPSSWNVRVFGQRNHSTLIIYETIISRDGDGRGCFKGTQSNLAFNVMLMRRSDLLANELCPVLDNGVSLC